MHACLCAFCLSSHACHVSYEEEDTCMRVSVRSVSPLFVSSVSPLSFPPISPLSFPHLSPRSFPPLTDLWAVFWQLLRNFPKSCRQSCRHLLPPLLHIECRCTASVVVAH